MAELSPEASAAFERIKDKPIVFGQMVRVRAPWGGVLENPAALLDGPRFDPITCKLGDAKVISPEELERRYLRATHRTR